MTTSASTTSAANGRDRGALAPLSYPIFRAVWIATVASNVGTWMQDIGNSWLMTSLSPSPLVISLVQAATSLPMFMLALPAGALADLVDRRRLLLTTQAWMSITALTLGILTLSGMTTVPVLICFAFLIGAGSAMNSPAFQAVVSELIPASELPRAVSLNSMGTNLARAVGPAIGGFLIAAAGPGATFVINGLSFIAVMIVLYRWKREPVPATLPAERLVGALRAGVRYALNSPALHTVFVRTAALMVGASAVWALLPLIARRELGLGPAGYGGLLTCMGAGAFGVVFILPQIRSRISADRIVVLSTLAFASAAVAIGIVRVPLVLMPVMVIAGAAWVSALSSLSVAAQRSAPPWARARALSCYLLVWYGSVTLGSTIWGALASRFGAGHALLASAGVLGLGCLTSIYFRLDRFETLNLVPAGSWPEPPIQLSPEPDAGPVMVQVEYRVSELHVTEFVLAMRAVRGERRRDGAISWGLYRDMHEPNRFVESFVVESWLEHLRQHQRAAVADTEFQQNVKAFLVSASESRVTHYIAADRS